MQRSEETFTIIDIIVLFPTSEGGPGPHKSLIQWQGEPDASAAAA